MSWRLLAPVVFVFAGEARAAPDTEACVAAFEQGQRLRKEDKLVRARAEFQRCGMASCPALVSKRCIEWMDQVSSALPSILIVVRDAQGRDLPEASIYVDGSHITRPRGKPLPVDPGEHLVRTVVGDQSVEQRVVVVQGERERAVTLVLPEVPRPPTPPPARTRLPVYLLGGVAALSLGSFAYFGLTGRNDADHLQSTCAPTCSDGQVSAVRRKLIAADVSLGIAAASLAVGTYLLLQPAAPVSVALTPGGALVGFVWAH